MHAIAEDSLIDSYLPGCISLHAQSATPPCRELINTHWHYKCVMITSQYTLIDMEVYVVSVQLLLGMASCLIDFIDGTPLLKKGIILSSFYLGCHSSTVGRDWDL